MAIAHYTDNPSVFPLEGGCSCGYLRYRVEKAPMVVHCCHCTACQRELGAAFTISLIIEAANLSMLPPRSPAIPAYPDEPDAFPAAGPDLSSTTKLAAGGQKDAVDFLKFPIPQESGEAQVVTRCPKCSITVWTVYPNSGPSVKLVRGGTLDRAWLVEPDLHLYVRSKRSFFKIEDGKPQFRAGYDRNAVWRKESLERWAKISLQVEEHKEKLKENPFYQVE
ncbi:hypothetical protein BD289DRAFT_442400 [Coniella lustricola]|uniref:CENP-V/GFA domain-containing protein n=1 Tax=Coniella lustricola TaxID=2025994 RepID=A0A2T2ZY99_9PEZI|nr:hypothetical protein BD289DRAFT_442400 [Coniella lustricola]